MITYLERGDCKGLPVLHFHGWPSSRLEQFASDTLLERLSLHWFSLDRPGYGGTECHPGRTLADWAKQVAAFADSQGIDRFHVVGFSGGGPYAMAVAHELPQRVISLTLICSLSPFGKPDGAGHPPPWKALGGTLIRRMPKLVVAGFAAVDRLRQWQPVAYERMQLRSFHPGDRAFCGSQEMQSRFIEIHAEAGKQGVRHLVEDLQLYATPWGFAPANIGVPTRIFVGGEDSQVPAACSDWLAKQIPASQLKVYPGEAHYIAYKHAEEILSGLVNY